MDAITFYAQRSARLEQADDELRHDVEDALQALKAGVADWSLELVLTASELWLEIFAEEAPVAGRGLALARFRRDLTAALEHTTVPVDEVSDGQINRITYWLSGYTVNAATHAAMFSNGTRFCRWVTMRDGEVRDIHKPLDGQIRPVGSTFTVADTPLHYPGEPVGPPEVWISCRCVIQPAARKGEAMTTTTTYTIGPEDPVEIDNPDIITSDDIVFVVTREHAAGTTHYGPFATREEADRWVERGGAGDGEYSYVGLTGVPDVVLAAATDPTDIAVEPVDEEDLVSDDADEEEDLITELPVHGVIAPEGIPTGDGRQFSIGSLSTRELPVPLRVETVGTHGGITSDVVTIGRVDEAWRDESTDAWRWRGAIVLDKPYASETIAGIIDGTIRGVSLDGDAAVEDTAERERLLEELSSREAAGGDTTDLLAELQALPTTYSAMRVAGLTIVPIPAFQEAYIGLGHDFTEDLTPEEVDALTACGCMDAAAPGIAGYHEDTVEYVWRDVSPDERRKMASDGRAMEDGSFPIDNEEDLRNAIQAIGRASDPAAAKTHIKKRAKALGKADLIPEDWSLEPLTAAGMRAAFAPGTHDGPGWITHPVPTSRIRRYWTRGKGAAKIRWGQPGDFNRCRAQLAKYVQNPDWLAGLCANMHFEALGIWPSSHRGRVRGAHALDGGAASPVITASGALRYPSAWFQNPGLERAMPLQVEGQRIYGYLAEWGVCHIGIEGMCRDVPGSRSGYGYFLKGVVDTDTGQQRVGTITYGIGHASPYLRAAAATAHYDQTDAVRAFVNIGEDAHGIWFAGVLAPWVTDGDVAALRAVGALSGDWRNWSGMAEDYELIGAVAVAVPGYQLAASGAIGLGYIPIVQEAEAILAAGTEKLDAELVGAIARTAVAEYRHQEKVEAAVGPHREKVRAERLQAARARLTKVS